MSTIWYARNVGDYQRKTRHLSMLEHGAYTMLLDWYYANDRAPNAIASELHRICMAFEPDEQAAMHRVLEQFFELRDGRWFNDRAEQELARRRSISEKRAEAAGKRWSASDASADAIAHTSTTTTTVKKKREAKASLRAPRFDEFWTAYPHRNGTKTGKAKAREIYARRVKDGVPEQTLIDGAQAAHRHPDVIRGYARDPTTWLNAEGWTDEIGQIVPIRQERPDGQPSRLDAFLSGARR
jgi:uncharacterized protein YdaU (DUF1376 family)